MSSLSQTTSSSRARRRVAIMALLLAAAVVAVYLSPLRQWLHDVGRFRERLLLLGAWLYPTAILAIGLLVAVGTPRLVFATAGGLLLGFWKGLLVAQCGTLLGYYLLFLFTRWGGREFVLSRWPGLGKWADKAQDSGILGVILMRQVPIHGSLTNLCLGLSRIRHRDFLIGSALGTISHAVPFTLLGAGIMKGSPGQVAGYIALAVGLLAVIGLGLSWLVNRLKKSRAAQVMDLPARDLAGDTV